MSVAGRDGTDDVDKLAKDAFIFSIFFVQRNFQNHLQAEQCQHKETMQCWCHTTGTL